MKMEHVWVIDVAKKKDRNVNRKEAEILKHTDLVTE